MGTKFLLHDVRAFKAQPVKYAQPSLAKFQYVVRGIGPFTHSPNGTGLVRCETLEQANRIIKQFQCFTMLNTNDQIEAVTMHIGLERLTGQMKRLMMCAAWMYGFKYHPGRGALYHDVPPNEMNNSNLVSLKALRQAKPIRRYDEQTQDWEDIVYKDIEPVSSSLDDTFGIGQPRTKSTKPWTPDEPRDDIDIMDSIRKACSGR